MSMGRTCRAGELCSPCHRSRRFGWRALPSGTWSARVPMSRWAPLCSGVRGGGRPNDGGSGHRRTRRHPIVSRWSQLPRGDANARRDGGRRGRALAASLRHRRVGKEAVGAIPRRRRRWRAGERGRHGARLSPSSSISPHLAEVARGRSCSEVLRDAIGPGGLWLASSAVTELLHRHGTAPEACDARSWLSMTTRDHELA